MEREMTLAERISLIRLVEGAHVDISMERRYNLQADVSRELAMRLRASEAEADGLRKTLLGAAIYGCAITAAALGLWMAR